MLFNDQNIRSEEEESPSLGIDPSFFEKPKSLDIVVHLNFSSRPRVKEIDDSNARSVIKNAAQDNWKAVVNIIFKHPGVNSANKACSEDAKITLYLLATMSFNNFWIFSKATAFILKSFDCNWSSIILQS